MFGWSRQSNQSVIQRLSIHISAYKLITLYFFGYLEHSYDFGLAF